jgi:pimeloyl-ACP methyl ester carboxylesterase
MRASAAKTSTTKRQGRRAALVAAAGGAAAAGWALQRRVDQRRIEADPANSDLTRPFEGRVSTVHVADGTALHVEEFGLTGGPTVVFVHGWTMALRFWRYQVEELARDHRVVAFDLRGHGRSEIPAGFDFSTDALADDLQAVLEACLPDGEKALLVGHSLGAMTIVAWAGRHPDEVARRMSAAALVCTGMGDLVSESLILRMPTPLGKLRPGVGRVLLSAPLPLSGPAPLALRGVKYVAMSPDASPAHVAFAEEMTRACRPRVRAGCGRSLSALDLHHAVAHLTVPTLVIAGEKDKLTPPGHARKLAEALPGEAELLELPGVGHLAPLENADAVTRALRALADRSLAAAAATA